MNYIYRELLVKITDFFSDNRARGLILSGVVGCGKTTLVEKVLESLTQTYEIFSFTGDDIQFRNKVLENSNYLYLKVKSKTNKPALIFVDEVQKTEAVFDCLKIAFDKGDYSFIVSGSNPEFLSTVAKRRLQRRAEQMLLLPLSLSELLTQQKIISENYFSDFKKILWEINTLKEIKLSSVSVTPEISQTINTYLLYGGLPLSILATTDEEKLREIRLTVERGFLPLYHDNNEISERIQVELALLHSKEFTYKNILEKTRLRRREVINKSIDQLLNHGYLVKKKPLIFKEGKSSYLNVFSYIDPGMASYLSAQRDLSMVKGTRIEGYVHSRLAYYLYNSVYKSELGYFKPYELDSNNNLRFQPGEIDFVIKHGKRILPIEVKATDNLNDINTNLLEAFIHKHKIQFALVLYGGAPFIDHSKNILYWPYWMI